ncbi:hypothetical protein OF83DRAFT_1177366 [Amylostereum chailletii]|nr:hypothetical protein OF83DRAFT_1177366 [Amylostereum chailletii]
MPQPTRDAVVNEQRSHETLKRLRSDRSSSLDHFDSSTPFTSTHRVTNDAQRVITKEMAGSFVGPMPVHEWFCQFMSVACHEPMQDVSFKKVASASTEKEMYRHFIEACRPLCGERVVVVDTSACGDPSTSTPQDQKGLSPDIMIYHCSQPQPTTTTDFSHADMFGDFKFTELADAFSDGGTASKFALENWTEMGCDTRGQIIAYANALLSLQFRLFCFSFLIMGSKARFIRWDRAGAIVSEVFDYVENPEPLAQYIWRYSHMSALQRGHDENATEATAGVLDSHEEAKIRSFLTIEPHRLLYLLRLPSDPDSSPDSRSFSTSCMVQPTDQSREYVVALPKYRARCPVSKATRSIFAYDRSSATVRHLKDTWRINSPEHEEEAAIIRKLQAAGVPHIGDVFAASDVLQDGKSSDTTTDLYATRTWAHPNQATTPRRYYRLVSAKLGRSLTTFSRSKELVQAIVDALEAHQYAEEAGYCHHDISVRNILITEDGRGLLIDWDSAMKVVDLDPSIRRKDLVGTWQFISAARAQDCWAPHLLLDDMESFFWVLLWVVLKFGRHGLTPGRVKVKLESAFDACMMVGGDPLGGGVKENLFLGGNFEGELGTKFEPAPLHGVLAVMHATLRPRYLEPVMPSDSLKPDLGPELWDERVEEYEYQLAQYTGGMSLLKDASPLRRRIQAYLDGVEWPTHDPPQYRSIPSEDSDTVNSKRSDSRESASLDFH